MRKEQSFLEEKLKKIDWRAYGKVDVSELSQELLKLGYHINDLQKDFLIKYATIEFNFPNPKLKKGINDLIRLRNPEHKFDVSLEKKYRPSFDPLEAATSILRYVIEEYENGIGKKLLIIGQLENENISLFISEDGYFYGGFDENIIEYGNSFEKMIYTLWQDLSIAVQK